MMTLGLVLVATPLALAAYAYAGYPLVVWSLAARRRVDAPIRGDRAREWPSITITLPVYNEGRIIRRKLEELLALDYPEDRRHILVISDASTDDTDAIAAAFANRGVELLRLPRRGGKTAAENAAGARIRGEIVVNTDAAVRLPRHSLQALVRAFEDPTVGVVSGRDVSLSGSVREGGAGESGYVNYEMWLRRIETRLGSIVGASGCFYGIRAALYDPRFPESLSRDFASALMARRKGYRAVAVEDAVCYVPGSTSVVEEYRRKVRTMSRGLSTLWYMRDLMDPRRHGTFAFMLISHKLVRWLVYLALPLAVAGMVLLAAADPVGRAQFPVVLAAAALAVPVWRWVVRRGARIPRLVALPAFIIASNAAGFAAWMQALRRKNHSIWQPTRRTA